MTFPTPQSLDGVNPHDHPMAFAYAPWFDSRYVLDDDIVMPYIRGEHLPDVIPLFALDYDNFRSHMCVVDGELETPKFGHSSARERFVHACGVHWGLLGGRLSLPAASGFDLPFALSDDEYTFCRWLALALEEDAPRFGSEFFHMWRGVCNVLQLIIDQVYARSALPTDFRNVPKGSQYLWRRSAPFERRARDQLGYLVPYECVEIFSFTDFARVSRHVPLPPKWASIEVPMGCAALLSPCISYLGSRLRNDADSGLWVLVYTSWAASCARYLLWDAYEYQRLWYFPPVLCAMIKALDLSVFLGGQTNADESNHLILIIESVEWSTVPIANIRRPKGWRRLSSQSPGRVEMAGDFVKYDPYTREVFVTEISLARGMQLSSRPSLTRLDSTCSSDEVQEVSVVSNTLARISARQSWIVTEDHTNNMVEAPRVTRLPATEFSLPLLLPSKPVFIVADTRPEVEAEELEVEEPSDKRDQSSSTTHPVASVSQSISITDWLSIIRDFVGRVGVDVRFAETEEEIRGYLRTKLESARQG